MPLILLFSNFKNFVTAHKNTFLLICILVISSTIRFWDLSNNPSGFNQDEAVNGYDSYTLGLAGMDHHQNVWPVLLESYEDWASPLLTYFTIPFIKIFGLNVFAVRLPTVILGLGSVVLIYTLTRQLLKKKSVSLLAALILAVSPSNITLSRWAIPPSSVTFFLLVFLVSFFWAVDDQFLQSQANQQVNLDSTRQSGFINRLPRVWSTRIKFIVAGLTAALATYAYPTQKLFMPLLVCGLTVIYIYNWQKLKVLWKPFLLGGLVFSLVVLPMYLPTLTNPNKYNRRFHDVSIFNIQKGSPILGFGIRYVEYFSPFFLFGPGDSDIAHQVPGSPNLPEVLNLFFYIGLIVCGVSVFKRKSLVNSLNLNAITAILVWVFLAPLAASLTNAHFMLLRSVQILPAVILISIIGLIYSLDFLPNRMFKRVSVGIIIFLIFSTFGIYTYNYFGVYPNSLNTKASYQYGVGNFMQYLKQHESQYNTVLVDNSINQPYIYYLFYTAKNPQTILHSEVNATVDAKGDWSGVPKIDKLEFTNTKDLQKPHWHELYKVQASNFTWYTVYEISPRQWAVVRNY